MSAIGKGDWVQCITTDLFGDGTGVVAGHVYFCEGLISGMQEDGCGMCGTTTTCGLILSGVTPNGTGWCRCNFRPLGGDGASVDRRELADA